MDEHSLIQGILKGDNNSFRELVSLYQDKVYHTVYSFVRNEEDALDLSQDVFIEIHQSIHKFRKESILSTWIYRISVNKALNHLKRSRSGSFISSMQNIFHPANDENIKEPSDYIEHPYEKMENKELAKLLQVAIDSLPKNQRIAFVLHKFEGLQYKEIAGIMDVSLSSVESLVHRARISLQKKLFNYYKGDL